MEEKKNILTNISEEELQRLEESGVEITRIQMKQETEQNVF
jgi:hypothetical protein